MHKISYIYSITDTFRFPHIVIHKMYIIILNKTSRYTGIAVSSHSGDSAFVF